MTEIDERHSVPSPCVRQCTLNDSDVCVGCGRTLDEVKAWSLASLEEQQVIAANAKERLSRLKYSNGF